MPRSIVDGRNSAPPKKASKAKIWFIPVALGQPTRGVRRATLQRGHKDGETAGCAPRRTKSPATTCTHAETRGQIPTHLRAVGVALGAHRWWRRAGQINTEWRDARRESPRCPDVRRRGRPRRCLPQCRRQRASSSAFPVRCNYDRLSESVIRPLR